jgi:hypothetical protein
MQQTCPKFNCHWRLWHDAFGIARTDVQHLTGNPRRYNSRCLEPCHTGLLRFQGKGVTLLLDWLAGARSEHRDRIVRHEAGHFLVAYFLGIPITGYTLTAWEAFKQGQPGLGGVSFGSLETSPDALAVGEMRLTLERFCTVWMAGIAAETIVYGSAEGGIEDRQKLRDALTALGRPASEFPLKERWATRQAHTIIQEHWESYEALVAAMEERASVAECSQVIQKYL